MTPPKSTAPPLTGKDRTIHELRQRIRELRAEAKPHKLTLACQGLLRIAEENRENQALIARIPQLLADASTRYDLETEAMCEPEGFEEEGEG